MNTQQIEISEYDYPLPDERIAKHPVAQRDHSRLLIYRHGEISDDTFVNIPQYLPEGALMVVNNTRVIQARIYFRKPTGALIEVFLLEPHTPADYEQMFQQQECCEWHCLVGNAKKWKEGRLSRTFTVDGQQYRLSATRVESRGADQVVRFEWEGDVPFATVIDHVGELPIPPYLNRATEESDGLFQDKRFGGCTYRRSALHSRGVGCCGRSRHRARGGDTTRGCRHLPPC